MILYECIGVKQGKVVNSVTNFAKDARGGEAHDPAIDSIARISQCRGGSRDCCGLR
jgi:hypothetical protein